MGHTRLELTGQRFGRLTALAPAANQGGNTAWRCRCDCGREIVALTKRLRRGTCTSCGCDKPRGGATPAEIGRASLTFVDGTCVEMLRARTRRRNNTSGVPGVDRWKNRWRAAICFQGRRRFLGSYDRFEDAVAARKAAEAALFDTFLSEFAAKQRTAVDS